MEGYAENGAGTDVTDQIGFGGMRRKRRKHRGLTVFQLKAIGAVASWFAIPIYAWLLVRGFRETHNRVAYGVQLLLLALICEVPYDLATSGKTFDFNSQNPVFGLFIAFVVLAALEWVAARYQKAMRVVLSVGLMSIGSVTLGFVLIFTLMRQYENSMMFTAGLFGAVMMIAPGVGVAFVHYYNGKLGYKHQWTKWAFYAVYPVILIICAICATLA